jgi:tetratricopeptide (TPR) repeat protein
VEIKTRLIRFATATFLCFFLQGTEIFANEGSYSQGQAYLDSGDFEKSVSLFTEMIKSHPDNEPAYIARAAAYNAWGKYELALHDLDLADQLDCELSKSGKFSYAPGATVERAKVYLAMKKYQRACDTITDLMSKNGDRVRFDGDTRLTRAMAYAGLGYYKEALEDIKYSIGGYISGSSSDLAERRRRELRASKDYELQAEWLLKIGRAEEAIDSFSDAIKVTELDSVFHTKRAGLYLERAKLYKLLGEDALARRDEQLALSNGKEKIVK